MIVECPRCEAKVDAKILQGAVLEYDDEGGDVKISLLECPLCKKGILVGQHYELYSVGDQVEEDFGVPVRLWPEPHKGINWSLPHTVHDSLDEAEKCYKAKAYSACAVMCGRALESVCHEYKTTTKMLGGGLKELLDKGIIDQKIFEWGEMLREYRNIGAHHTPAKVSKDDAKDLLDFAVAICDYVFVLTKKFENFKKRKKSLKGRGKVKKVILN